MAKRKFDQNNLPRLSSEKPYHKVLRLEATSTKSDLTQQSTLFCFMGLPGELRNRIYEFIFAPTPSEEIQPPYRSGSLTLAYVDPESSANVNLKKIPGLHYSRPTGYQFLFVCHQIYKEALPVLARSTSLHLSGTTYRHIKFTIDTEPTLRYLAELQNSVAYNTSHLILDQPVLRPDAALVNALISGTLFPHLRKLTLHQAGPGQLTCTDPSMALSAAEARKIVEKKEWPADRLQRQFAGLPLRPLTVSNDEMSWIFRSPPDDRSEDDPSFPIILQNLRKRLDASMLRESIHSKDHAITIEVVWSLPVKDMLTTIPPCPHVILDKVEMTVDFDMDKIIDVTFSKKYMTNAAAICDGRRRKQWMLFPPVFRSFWAKPE